MENNLNPSNNQTPIEKGNSLENILKSNEKKYIINIYQEKK